jgi:hypothetical protein
MGAFRGLSCLARRCCLAALLGACLGSEDSAAQGLTAAVAPDRSGSNVNAALSSTIDLPAATLQGTTPAQVLGLIRTDRDRLAAALRGFGFYEGQVEVLLNGEPLDTEADTTRKLQKAFDQGQVAILYVPTYGPAYRIRSVRVVTEREGTEQVLCDVGCPFADQVSGKPATVSSLAQIEADWLSRQRQTGSALDAVIDRTISPDSATKTVDVTLAIEMQPQARLGPVHFQGLQRIDPDALQRYVPFRPGDQYRPALLEHLRAVLDQSSLFRTIHIDLAPPDESGLRPVTVSLVERPQPPPQFPLLDVLGVGVFVATALVLATNLLARASVSPFWRSLESPLNASALVFLLLSSLVALERFLYLANV